MDSFVYDWLWDRIDKYLTVKFWYSRNFFHHIIDRWWVLVNNKIVKKSYKLKEWDNISIDNFERYLTWDILSDLSYVDLDILLEKDDYLLVNKPKWVLSHPWSVRDISTPSVVWFIANRYKNLPSIWNFIRAWLIHRLDKETDWPMIIAKTEKWLSYFSNLFKSKSDSSADYDNISTDLRKFYKARVYIKDFKNTIFSKPKPFYIKQDVVPLVPNPIIKEWVTKILSIYEVWEFYDIDIEILTWRTHQIRYHLSSNWAEILGDYLYSSKKIAKYHKLMLSCSLLEFNDLYWDYISIKNPDLF